MSIGGGLRQYIESSGKIAIVGLGYWGPNLLRNLIGTVGASSVVAIDRDLDRLAASCAQHPTISCATSLDQALVEHDVRGVIVATPVTTHAELTMTALDAGCHVLVEKPLAASSVEALALVDRAEAAGLTLMVGHTFLFSPRVQWIERFLADGRLGAIQYLTSERLNLGLHQSDVSVIWDLAPHDLSIIFRLLGETPRRIRTCGRGTVRNDRADVAFVHLEFPSGVVASVSLSWLAPSKSRSTIIVGDRQMLVYDDLDAEQPIRVFDKGVVPANPGDFGEHQLTYRHGDMRAPHIVAREPLAQEIAHFIACVEGVETPISDGRFGLEVVRAMEAAEQSWFEGGASVDLVPAVPRPRAPRMAAASST